MLNPGALLKKSRQKVVRHLLVDLERFLVDFQIFLDDKYFSNVVEQSDSHLSPN